MEWSLPRKIALGVASALAALSVASYQTTRHFREINHRVAHTHEVLREIVALRAELKDAESSQLGYVLTGKESYLDAFGRAKLRIDAHLKDLLQLTEDDPDQEHRLSSLEPRIGDRLAQLQAAVETRRQGGFEAARRIVVSDEGKEARDTIRRLTREMERGETSALERRLEAAQESGRSATIVLSLFTSLACVFMLLAYWLSRRAEEGRGRVVGVTEDVTERQVAEEALRESEKRYRLLFERSLAGVCLSEPDGRIVDCNKTFAQIFGYASAAELFGRSVWDLYFDASECEAMLTALQKTGSFSGLEFRAQRKDGGPIWLLGSVALIPNPSGAGQLTQATVIDISERKQAESVVRSLLRISERLNSTLDVDALIDSLVREAIDLVHAEGGCSGLRTSQGMACHKIFRKSEITPFEYCWPPGEGAPGWVLAHKTPYISNDVARESQLGREPYEQFAVRSLITTPILDSEGEVIGFFEIHNKKDGLAFTTSDQQTLFAVSQAASVAIQNAKAYCKVRQAEEGLRQLSGNLLRSQDEERRRIARELHDSTAQSLAALVINLTRLDESPAELGPGTRDLIADSLALAEQCARELRTLSYLLHPPLLDELGLGAALRQYVNGFAQRSGIRVDLNVPVGVGCLSQDVATTLFRLVQESLTNIHKHSGSQTAAVRLARRGERLTLEVKDEGRGIPSERLRVSDEQLAAFGVGITGMRERVRQLGGQLEIKSDRQGTTVTAILPFPEGQA